MTIDQLLIILGVAASPVAELRLAIPMAIHAYGISWPAALLVSLIGNILPVPFILLLLGPLRKLAAKIKPLDRIMETILNYSRRRSEQVRKYERIGLMLFVGVPLPGTGAWTGSIIAYLLGLKFHYAFFSIALGVVMAGVIVTALSLLGWIGAAIAGLVLAVLAVAGLRKTWD